MPALTPKEEYISFDAVDSGFAFNV